MSKDRSDRFTWGEGDVEHHSPKVQEIKWMKVGNIPVPFRENYVTEMFLAVNVDTKEIFAGIHRLAPMHNGVPACDPFWCLTYTTDEDLNKPDAAVALNLETFEECLKEGNDAIAKNKIFPHSQKNMDTLMLEDFDVT